MRLEDFPISESEARDKLKAIAKQIHSRYRSPFALVLILPQAIWAGKVLEEELIADGAHPIVHGIGVMTIDTEKGPRTAVIEPPSEHGIRGKKVVLLDAQGDNKLAASAGKYIVSMKPQTVEVATLFCKGDVPEWRNPDYIGFTLDNNILVTGLGLGYNQEQASGGAFTATEISSVCMEEGAGNEVKLEEVEHERS